MKTDYEQSEFKCRARLENVNLYRKITGLKSIPSNKEYWTLCNIQSQESNSEINQLISLKLITTTQFVGVDFSDWIIKQNKKSHPKARFYCGDWSKVIRTESFNPGMIYLDTTSFADHNNAIRLLSETMLLCPVNTVIFANFMMNDPRSSKRFYIDGLIISIQNSIPSRELNKWNKEIPNFEYSMTGLTRMGTFVFHKLTE